MDHSSTILEAPPPQPNGVLDDGNLLRNVLSYVGKNQYRFIGTVDHTFHDTYVSLHPEKTTQYNVSTMEHAAICCNEVSGYSGRFILCEKAVTIGNLPVLQFLFSNKCPIHCVRFQRSSTEKRDDLFIIAVRNGHVHILQWLQELGDFSFLPKYRPSPGRETGCAADNGDLDMLQWLHTNGFPWSDNVFLYAAGKGHLLVLQYLRDLHCPCVDEIYWIASLLLHCQYNAVQCILTNECWISPDISTSTYNPQTVQILQWLHYNNVAFNEDAVRRATKILKWNDQYSCEFRLF